MTTSKTKTKKTTIASEDEIDAEVDPNEMFDSNKANDLEKLEDGFSALSGRVRAFDTIGQEIRGIFSARTPVKKKNMSDILSFLQSDNTVIQCWSSAGIDQTFEKAGIEANSKYEVIIRYLGKQSIGGRKTFKQFHIQSRQVK
jgi:hypothetical protein